MNMREDTAKYYDLQSFPIDDVGYYEARVPSWQARILELGCGTGRVLLPLAAKCSFIQGIDSSPAMLAICLDKLRRAGLPLARAQATEADITNLNLDDQFDLIIAPFRVFQTLESDEEVIGVLDGIHRCLAPGGVAILNVFNPNRPREEMLQGWCTTGEHIDGETAMPDGERLVRLHRRPRLQPDPLVVYPELIYRRYNWSGSLEDEAIMKIAMRCWYPHELEERLTTSGFCIKQRWGGYAGEQWGEGPELVIEFEQ